MRLMFSLAMAFTLTFLQPDAVRADAWQDASGGQSSFRDLGPGFSVTTKVREVEGARVVLWNFELAKRLGLTAQDIRELEKLILKNFAVTTIGAENSTREMFATKYQDYDLEDLKYIGNPKGDGRAVWAGELRIPLENGRIAYLDVSLKGVGRTPLAREKLSEADGTTNSQYSDGLQSMSEALRGFITSVSLNKNGVQAVQDLAVIELPFEKIESDTGMAHKAAITVRVGEQTRIGHVEYQLEQEPNPLRFRRIFEFAVRRALGLGLNTKIQKENVQEYLRMVRRNLSAQAASYLDLNFVHGSLTRGNQTTAGRPIDFGTSQIFSGFHADLRYFNDQLYIENQVRNIASYLVYFHKFAKKWEFGTQAKLESLASESYFREVTRDLVILQLQRLGLSPEEIRMLPHSLIKRFVGNTVDLLDTRSEHKLTVYGQEISPGVFDLNEILKSSMAILESPEAGQPAAWRNVFVTKRGWATLKEDDLRSGAEIDQGLSNRLWRMFQQGEPEKTPDSTYYLKMQAYIGTVSAIHQKLKEKGESINEVIGRARAFAKTPRNDMNFPDLSGLSAKIAEGQQGFEQLSRDAMGIIETIHDRNEDLSNKDVHPLPMVRCRALLGNGF